MGPDRAGGIRVLRHRSLAVQIQHRGIQFAASVLAKAVLKADDRPTITRARASRLRARPIPQEPPGLSVRNIRIALRVCNQKPR